MPRHNKPRSIASEANVAERITRERESRELSYEALAKLMTDQGCSLVGSAVYRIEKGDPPRHITVDELVAFATVFDTTVPDLLVSVETVDRNGVSTSSSGASVCGGHCRQRRASSQPLQQGVPRAAIADRISTSSSRTSIMRRIIARSC